MLEVKPGVFLSKVSAIVREALWNKVKEDAHAAGAILAYSAPTEIGYLMEMHGGTDKKHSRHGRTSTNKNPLNCCRI